MSLALVKGIIQNDCQITGTIIILKLSLLFINFVSYSYIGERPRIPKQLQQQQQ